MGLSPENKNQKQSHMNNNVGLHTAALKGDWEHALSFEGELDRKITDKSETILHIAAIAQHTQFVEKLVNRFKRTDFKTSDFRTLTFLEAENTNGNTALCYAAASGIVRIAEVMIDAYEELYYSQNRKIEVESGLLPNRGQIKPVFTAAMLGHCEMVKYLIQKTDIDGLNEKDRVELFISCLGIDLYDVALQLLSRYPELAISQNESSEAALHVMARKSSAFVLETRRGWRKCLDLCFEAKNSSRMSSKATKLVQELCKCGVNTPDLEKAGPKPMTIIAQSLLIAAEEGNSEFVVELIRFNPDLVWKVHPHKGSIFHIAVRFRHESVFSLIYELGSIKDLIATNTVTGRNNLLHLAAELAPASQLAVVPGAAFQMQRELLWYKEVEKIVQPSYQDAKNSKGKTPRDLFNEKHRELRRSGEKWVKDTAKTSMLVAALICTATFTAFRGPLHKQSAETEYNFQVFSVFNASALLFSSVSVVMFLSILGSGFSDDDFVWSLPARLTVGVLALFGSVLTMMGAFLVGVSVYCSLGWSWVCVVFLCFCGLVLCVAVKNSVVVGVVGCVVRARSMRSRKRLF